jgi:hypothetical protein
MHHFDVAGVVLVRAVDLNFRDSSPFPEIGGFTTSSPRLHRSPLSKPSVESLVEIRRVEDARKDMENSEARFHKHEPGRSQVAESP